MELIEREGFLSLLQTHFNEVADGDGHCVLVSGEAGIGKTTLVKAFCKQLSDKCLIYQGACDALFTPRPLAPLYDILWQVNKDRWPANPRLDERSALFEDFLQELSTKKEETLIVFEDIHWADEGTLDFIKFFARRITQLHCLFILTYRDAEIHSRHPLRNVLGQLSPDSFTKLHLTPLSKPAVERMAVAKGYNGEDVYSISCGNPFYVNEILASYSPGVPENIKDSVLSVYERQAEETKNAWQIFSIIPDGLEIDRFVNLKSLQDYEIDHCFAMNILVVQNSRVLFKHELYRRTIEESLSPFKRIELNKMILGLFLDSFEQKGEIERIVHYAKNAREKELVVKYAPLAAKQAALAGAHTEASKLYLVAIEHCDSNEKDCLVKFYESYAYECYLINQIKDAIICQEKALKIWKEKNEAEQIGNALRLLSELWWLKGNRENAEKYGKQAIDVFQSLPSSKAKAMAFSNMSLLKMFSEETAECIDWGDMAMEMAAEIKDDEILCQALISIGSAQWRANPSEEKGKELLLKGLNSALTGVCHELAARAYSIVISNCVTFKEYDLAKQYLQSGLAYCEERNLDASKNYKLSLQARMLLETGDWHAAALIIKGLLKNSDQPAIIKIGSLATLATIKIRKGEPDAVCLLHEMKSLAFGTKEHNQVIPAIIACLEYEWLTCQKLLSEEELNYCAALMQKSDNIFLNSACNFWLQKAGRRSTDLSNLYEPYKLLQAGKISRAADFWKKKGCAYEEAFALFEGDGDNKKEALAIFQHLGADAVGEKIKMEMRASGIKNIPRGIRDSTKANPAQLTNRELDIIQLLQKAVQNKEIAETLFISPKTVDHHISSILFKLEVNSRSKAVKEAIRLGILK